MRSASLLMLLALECVFNNPYCSEAPVLSHASSAPLAQVSLDEQKESLLRTIDGLIPLLNAHINFASKVIEHIGKFKTDTSDIEDAEIAEFVDLHLSNENMSIYKLSPKNRARVLYQQHANDEIANQYFIRTLQDLKWALIEMDTDVSHHRIQQTLLILLKNIADFNDATCNDIARLILVSEDKALKGYFELGTLTEQQLHQLADSTTPRQQRISLIDTVVNYADETSRPELHYQHQLAMFCMEMENKLLPFCAILPINFSKDCIRTGFTDEINKLVTQKINHLMSDLLNPEQPDELSLKKKKLQKKILERHEKRYTLADEFPSEASIKQFLNKKLTLRQNIHLTPEQEFLPDYFQKKIIAAERKKILERKKKAKAKKIEHSIPQSPILIPEMPKKEVVSSADTPPIAEKDIFIESENKLREMEILAIPNQPTPVDDEQWDYWTWYSQQDFSKKQNPILDKQQDNIIKEHLSFIDTLTGKALVFYKAVFGLGSKNVTQSDFNEFLKQIGGQKMKQTPRGLKIVRLNDTSVLCTYTIPDLANPGNMHVFKVHQPHGNQPFPMRTLKSFLNPQLSLAGYDPQQGSSPERIIPKIDTPNQKKKQKGKKQ